VQHAATAVIGALLAAALLAFGGPRGLGWASFGLLVVPVLGVGLTVGLGRHIGLFPEARVLRAHLDEPHAAQRLTVRTLSLLLAWLVGGELGLVILGHFEGAPQKAGVVLAAVLLALVLVLSWLADVVSARLEAQAGITRSCDAWGRWGLVIPLLLFVLGVGVPVALGETAGRGHALALMGVFRRPELDLTPLLELVLLMGLAFVAGEVPLRARRGSVWAAPVLLGLSLSAAWTARGLTAKEATELGRERGLSQVMLALHTRLSDADRDGVAARYGGGDCDDADDRVFPGAVEPAGSSRDLDCDGQLPAAAPKSAPPVAQPRAAQGARLWPPETNVLLLTVDTLRFDLGFTRMGPAGRLSPRLDELARHCAVYDRAYSLASYTSKSLAPMLIGKYSSETARTFEHFDRFRPSEAFVQERLQKAGVRTESVQAYWYFFLKGYGFERGWDNIDHEAAPKAIAVDGDASVTGEKLADRTIARLAELDQAQGRFFMWAHWVDPHSEYVPHADFNLGSSSRERYDGEVAYVDHQLGRVLDALAQRPFAERTAILITSDHGEAFGEHGMIRHGFELWDELVRVPLLLCLPKADGRHIGTPRSAIDVVPTILELLDVPAEPGSLSGVSLLPDLTATVPAQRPVLIDMPRGPNNQERRAFITGSHKLITSAGRVIGLYDLAADPSEKTDLSADQALTARLQAELKAYLARLRVQAPG
jgi:choline-sulfatase